MSEIINNIKEEKTDKMESSRTNLCFSLSGEPQITPEKLIARGRGSGKPSVCQKL